MVLRWICPMYLLIMALIVASVYAVRVGPNMRIIVHADTSFTKGLE